MGGANQSIESINTFYGKLDVSAAALALLRVQLAVHRYGGWEGVLVIERRSKTLERSHPAVLALK